VAVLFDDSLRILVETVSAELGPEAVDAGVVLRDASGRLSFFSAQELDQDRRDKLAESLRIALAAYARQDRVVATPSNEGAESVLQNAGALICKIGGRTVRVVDRRLVGADWLRSPSDIAPGPPRFVFASLKGGVGRSTALAVTAAHLAAKGSRVLAIDLDLEAPGLGSFLLSEETVPDYGTLDYLVENKISDLHENFFVDMVGPSGLATQGGRIDVIPAFGRRSIRSPADVLTKLSRAYLEHLRPDGTTASILDQIRALVDRFSSFDKYDVVLVDARAGLHETTAASILGLGADVFLFALDEPQTFQGYAALLAHLSRFVDGSEKVLPEWIDRLTSVHAKASADADQRSGFDQRWQALVARHGPLKMSRDEIAIADSSVAQGFHDIPWDENAADADVLSGDWSLLQPLGVLRNDRFDRFDPLRNRDLLEGDLYRSTFGDLLRRIERAVFPEVDDLQ
jgi:cellulose biosynthesis protein BcsQ